MIGRKVEFKNPDKRSWWNDNNPKPPETLTGTVLDKISEVHGYVSPGWARSMTGNSNDVSVNQTSTYYMVAEDGNGIMHRLSPHKILKVCDKP